MSSESGLQPGRTAPGARYGRLAPVRPPGAGRGGAGRLPRGSAGLGTARSGGSARWSSPGPGSPGAGGPRRGGPRSGLRRALGPRSALRHLDWTLLAAVLALAMIGTLLVWSATAPALRHAGADPRTYLMKQLLNIGLGLILMLTVSMLDSRQLRLYAPIVYGVSCLGLLAVLSPLGSIVNGARSWISLPAGFQIEPSEFAKLGIILMVAVILGELRAGEARPRLAAAGLAAGCAAVPIALVAAEPDLGVVILLGALAAGLTALSGLRLRWLAALAAGALLAGYAMLRLHLLKAYQVSRLTAFIHPGADPRGTGYSAAQAKIAIGSGGVLGQGLFHGQLVAGNFVPEQHTDFIFAVAGEELGLAGTAAIIGLLAVLLLRALRIAARAQDQFGMLVAAGIAIWFAVQVFINIGMTVGIMPVTGLPLPFVSYGGSAMFADMIAMGVLQAVHRRRRMFG